MTGDRLVYVPGLRTAWLRKVWGKPGPDGGWQLTLPGVPSDVRPPRRGMPPEEVDIWLHDTLRGHGWRPAVPDPWPPLARVRVERYYAIQVVPLLPG
ncbi:hypothetical protein ABZ897_43235 [Nonomuraea sp. NPDC046802]|uniref:hypothetical protein n=1 Tax=Nonomuraea sp. NPDC046802 TaxID=3154919 RepID=UPI0033E09426